MLPCLDLHVPVSDYESDRIKNLSFKMTLHRIYILYTIFEDCKEYVIYGILQSFYDYIHTDALKRPDLVDQKEPVQ